MKLHNLRPAKGATHKAKRIGRGEASGKGGTSTKGNKGGQSRAGYKSKMGFEGGQMPIQRRVPKRGFKNINRVEYKVINIGQVETAPTTQTVVAQPTKPIVEVITNPVEAPKAKSVSIDINTTKAAAAPQASTTAINPAHSLWQLEQMDILSLAKDLFFQPEWDNLNPEEYVNLSKLFKRVFDKKLPSKESIQFLLQFPVKLPVPELSKLTLSKAHEISVLEVELLGKAFEIVNYTAFLDHFVFEQEGEVITVRTKKINETQIFGEDEIPIPNAPKLRP
jgi:ribosomal protein L15